MINFKSFSKLPGLCEESWCCPWSLWIFSRVWLLGEQAVRGLCSGRWHDATPSAVTLPSGLIFVKLIQQTTDEVCYVGRQKHTQTHVHAQTYTHTNTPIRDIYVCDGNKHYLSSYLKGTRGDMDTKVIYHFTEHIKGIYYNPHSFRITRWLQKHRTSLCHQNTYLIWQALILPWLSVTLDNNQHDFFSPVRIFVESVLIALDSMSLFCTDKLSLHWQQLLGILSGDSTVAWVNQSCHSKRDFM